jgi:hypothetical protein
MIGTAGKMSVHILPCQGKSEHIFFLYLITLFLYLDFIWIYASKSQLISCILYTVPSLLQTRSGPPDYVENLGQT